MSATAALVTALEAVRLAVIITLGESAKPWRIEKALNLDPANPEIHHRMGLAQFYSSAASDPTNGLRHLRRASELNPNEAVYWLDLGPACETSQNATCADLSFQRAIELSPMTPRLYWAAANYALRAGQPDKALARFRRLLQLDSTYADAVFQACSRALDSGQWTGASVLNLNPPLRLALVNFLERDGQPGLADTVWHQLAGEHPGAGTASGAPFAFSVVEPYMDHLIGSGKQRQAMTVWNDLLALGVITALSEGKPANGRIDAVLGRQYVFNGGFEETPLNGGFDWRYQSAPFFSVTFPTSVAHSGFHAARIEFTEEQNDEYEPVFQWVPVRPEQSYQLTAFVRTQGLTSDAGPRLVVLDPRCTSCLDAATEPTTGTTPWHQVRVAFTTGPQTSLVRLSIWRPRSRAFPFNITGTFWLDDVSVTATQPDSSSRALARATIPIASAN